MNPIKQREYIGNLWQVFGIKHYTLTDGKSKGIKAADVKNGAGLAFTVLYDHCMDLSEVSYKGVNLSFQSKTGIASRAYYTEDSASGFLQCFNAGMLTSCGLTYMGAPCEDEGKSLGLHGNIHHTPAENSYGMVQETEGEVVLGGQMREAEVFSTNLVLSRTIRCPYGTNKIVVQDTIKNEGFVPSPLMYLYHINFGYPFLDEGVEIDIPHHTVVARDAESEKGLDAITGCEKPLPGRMEQCYFYTPIVDENGFASYTVKNPSLGFSVKITFDASAMPCLTQWKSMACGDYALGIEPGTFFPLGRAEARKQNKLCYLDAQQEKTFSFTLEIIDES